jgi:hypothetical protein
MLVFTVTFATIIFIVAISTVPATFPNVPGSFIYLMAASYGVYFIDKGVNLATRKRETSQPGLTARLDEIEERLRLAESRGISYANDAEITAQTKPDGS